MTNPIRDVRLFENPVLELFTMTPWYVIPIVWIPLVLTNLLKASNQITFIEILLCFSIGISVWTLTEYILHRFAFHGETLWLSDSRHGIFIHFLLHGIHHAFPSDPKRLVFPPLLGLVLLKIFFIPIFSSFLPEKQFPALLAGGITGYILYDMTHYFVHHLDLNKSKKKHTIFDYFISLKRYHMYHHYRDDTHGFGVSSKLWDVVFGTKLLL